MDISYTKEFKSYVNVFCKHIKEQVNLIIKRHEDTEGKVYFCAISRKTPKLMDLLHEQLGSIWDSLEIITEFTVPFIDKAGCTRQFESELSLRSFAQLFPIKEGFFENLPVLPYP